MKIQLEIKSAKLLLLPTEQDIVFFEFDEEHIKRYGEVSALAKMTFKRDTGRVFLEENNIEFTVTDKI